MSADIAVSYIVSVYNKEPYVGYTVQSLLQQEGGIASEYIFVDDVSTDRSLDIIAAATRGHENVVIICNTTNAGPSVRVNQGARLARGKYLQFIDSDDILAANATRIMLTLMEKYGADVVHGGWEKTGQPSASLLGRKAPENPAHTVSKDPRTFIFTERLRRMAQMVRRDVFMESGGCDERVFIQDESLPLRLARVAKRMVFVHTPLLLIPYVEGELSRNVSQLNHDRFLAHYDMLVDFPDLDDRMRRQLYRRCISAVWKQRRHMGGTALVSPEFRRYVRSRLGLLPVNQRDLQAMSAFFAHVEGVRRVAGRKD